MRSVVWIRRLASACVIFGAAAALATNASCVLLDGPADLPLPATRRPTILRSQVSPSASIPLGGLPVDGFVVPIEIPDPTQDVVWVAYFDLDLSSGANPQNFVIAGETISGSSDAPNIAYANFSVPPGRVIGNSCHTVHFVVALASAPDDPNLSDSIDWFIVPGGNAGGCTTYDGGGYSLIPDAAATDASDGGGD